MPQFIKPSLCWSFLDYLLTELLGHFKSIDEMAEGSVADVFPAGHNDLADKFDSFLDVLNVELFGVDLEVEFLSEDLLALLPEFLAEAFGR